MAQISVVLLAVAVEDGEALDRTSAFQVAATQLRQLLVPDSAYPAVEASATAVTVTATAMMVQLASQRRKGVSVTKIRKFASVAPGGIRLSDLESNWVSQAQRHGVICVIG